MSMSILVVPHKHLKQVDLLILLQLVIHTSLVDYVLREGAQDNQIQSYFASLALWHELDTKLMTSLLSQLVIHFLLVDRVVFKVGVSLLMLMIIIVYTLLRKHWGIGLIQRGGIQYETCECCPKISPKNLYFLVTHDVLQWDSMVVRQMGIKYVLILIKQLYLSGVWLGVNLVTYIKKACVQNTILDSEVNII